MSVENNVVPLQLDACIGFSGSVIDGLKITLCGKYVIYPLGRVLIIKGQTGAKTAFLEGHSNDICSVALSRDGRFLASGQINHPGVKADICIWDISQAVKNCDSNEARAPTALVLRFQQHIGKVQSLDFSCDGNYLASIGGQDDNSLIVWDIFERRAVCGATAAQDSALAVKWLNCRNDRLVTAGNYNLRVWQLDAKLPKLHAVDAKMGTVRRIFTCICITADDSQALCGTRTGDLMRFRIDRDNIQSFNDPDTVLPSLSDCSQEKFERGIRTVVSVLNPKTGGTNFLVGTGNGTVSFVNPSLNPVKNMSCQLLGGCTSIAIAPNQKGFFCGTDLSNRYWISMDMRVELRGTAHHGRVNDIVFPEACPTIFATSSIEDIRIWDFKRRRELLRIQVPNLECSCIGITKTGSTIVSGWSDGKIRGFFPESGKLKFVINNAHADGVTSLALARDDDSFPPWRIVSGGADGRVRIWNITPSHQSMGTSWKEHRGSVNCIKINKENTQCVSSSDDGSCIVWDMDKGIRVMAMFESTMFKAISSHPDESQYITCGSNHKITYWDAYDCTVIREIEGGEEGMNDIDVDTQGKHFVSGGDDFLVKVWHYDDGVTTALGRGHSGKVNRVRISPDGETIISVGSDGGIFIWRLP